MRYRTKSGRDQIFTLLCALLVLLIVPFQAFAVNEDKPTTPAPIKVDAEACARLLTGKALAKAREVEVLFHRNNESKTYELEFRFRGNEHSGHRESHPKLPTYEQWIFFREVLSHEKAEKSFNFSGGITHKFKFSRFAISEWQARNLHHEGPKSNEEAYAMLREVAYTTVAQYPELLSKALVDAVFQTPVQDANLLARMLDIAFVFSLSSEQVPRDGIELVSLVAGYSSAPSNNFGDIVGRDSLRDFLLLSMDLVQSQMTKPFANVAFDSSAWKGKTARRTIQWLRLIRNLYALDGALIKLDVMTQSEIYFDREWKKTLKRLGLVDSTVSQSNLSKLTEATASALQAKTQVFFKDEVSENFDPEVIAHLEKKWGDRFLIPMNLTSQLLTSFESQFLVEDLMAILSAYSENKFSALKFDVSEASQQIGFLDGKQKARLKESRAQFKIVEGADAKEGTLLITLNLQGAGLLGIGDLTGNPTCLSPTMGCNAMSAIAYALDAHTQGIAGFALKSTKLAPGLWTQIRTALKETGDVKASFDEESWEVKLVVSGSKYLVIPLPQYAVLRRVIRVGTTPDSQVGIGQEPLYSEPSHPALAVLENEMKTYIGNMAHDLGAHLDQPVLIRKSRLQIGTYTDSMKSFTDEDFTIEPQN